MEFTTNMKYVYTGDDVELACTVHSMDPNYPTISLKDSSSLSSHDTRRKQLDSYTVRTELWIHEQFGQKTDYVCVAERDERDEMSERIEQELSIYSYGKLMGLQSNRPTSQLQLLLQLLALVITCP